MLVALTKRDRQVHSSSLNKTGGTVTIQHEDVVSVTATTPAHDPQYKIGTRPSKDDITNLIVSGVDLKSTRNVQIKDKSKTKVDCSSEPAKLWSGPQCLNQSGKSPGIENTRQVKDSCTKQSSFKVFSKWSKLYSGPTSPRNLRRLSTAALAMYFPGLDPLDVAILFSKKVCESSKLEKTEPVTTEVKDLKKEQIKEINYDAYLTDLAAKKKVSVTISKLDDEVIHLWTKTHWLQLDPYSSLEEASTGSPGETIETDMDTNKVQDQDNVSVPTTGYILRQRKCQYTTERLRRNSAHKFYRDMCYPADRKKPRPNTGLKSLSDARIQSQNKIKDLNSRKLRGETVNECLVRSYVLFQPIRPETDARKESALPVPEASNGSEDCDSDAIVVLPVPKSPKIKERTINCSVKTITFGLIKHVPKKKVRYY